MIFQGAGTRTVDAASKVTITDDHVAAGTRTFTVDNASGFKVGDEVLVGRPVTAKWVSFMRMDQLVRNGAPQTWISVGSVLNAERVITAIEGNKITVDIPLSDSMAGEYVKPPGGSLTKYRFDRLSEMGIEHLRVVGQPRTETVNFNFLQINTVVDAWVKDVVAHDVTTGVGTNGDAKRITIEDTTISHTTVEYVNPAKPADFNIDASQVLIHRSASRGSNRSFSMITQSGVPGPTVVLNFAVSGISPPIQPHQRWATGLLVDNANLEQGGIEFINRDTAGSGHGWSIGWGGGLELDRHQHQPRSAARLDGLGHRLQGQHDRRGQRRHGGAVRIPRHSGEHQEPVPRSAVRATWTAGAGEHRIQGDRTVATVGQSVPAVRNWGSESSRDGLGHGRAQLGVLRLAPLNQQGPDLLGRLRILHHPLAGVVAALPAVRAAGTPSSSRKDCSETPNPFSSCTRQQ